MRCAKKRLMARTQAKPSPKAETYLGVHALLNYLVSRLDGSATYDSKDLYKKSLLHMVASAMPQKAIACVPGAD